MSFCFFFFKQKTAYEMRISDWSSDVCSSDLARERAGDRRPRLALGRARRKEEIVAMVPQDHRLRRRVARRVGQPRQMARQGAADAGKLDRQVAGAGIFVQTRGRRAGLRRLHDASRYALWRELRSEEHTSEL